MRPVVNPSMYSVDDKLESDQSALQCFIEYE